MPLDATLVGSAIGAVKIMCDARWTSAFAAGVGDTRPELYDTRSSLAVHPMFCVAPEWEWLTSQHAAPDALIDDELRRGVHFAHDLILERPVVAGETVRLSAMVSAVGRRRAGASQELILTAVDDIDRTVWRTKMTSVFLGVELLGEPTSASVEWPEVPARSATNNAPVEQHSSWVSPIDAHVYTECARIWNPIHTDIVAAQRAGLSAPILHGTATLARAVSIVTSGARAGLEDVRRIACKFAAPVDLGTSIEIRVLESTAQATHFEVVNHHGDRAIRDGVVLFQT